MADGGLIKALSDDIVQSSYFARHPGGRVFLYERGVYVPGGEIFIRSQVKATLSRWGKSKSWTSKLGKEVVEYISLGLPELEVTPAPDILNLENGVLDLGRLDLYPHFPEFLSACRIPLTYDPHACCPRIEEFFHQVLPADSVNLAWQIAGDLLTPDRSIQKTILAIGEGGNGKSVFLNLLVSFVGPRNVTNLSLQKLETDRFAVARLYGKLANICADLPSEHLVNSAIFKSLTGGDRITGEFKFCDSFEFTPCCRLVFSANHLPQSKDASPAFHDRWLIIPFERRFRGTAMEVRRDVLDRTLTAPDELAGALNRALPALRMIRQSGQFSETKSTRAAIAEYRKVTDFLGTWIEEKTITAPELVTSQEGLHTGYNRACIEDGRPILTKQAFGRALARLQPGIQEAQRTIDGRRQWVYIGIGMRG